MVQIRQRTSRIWAKLFIVAIVIQTFMGVRDSQVNAEYLQGTHPGMMMRIH